MVYRIAISQVGNKNDADDIFQDVFLQLVRHINVLENEQHVKHWLIRTTINRCKNHFTSSWKKKIIDSDISNLSIEEKDVTDIYYLVLALKPRFKSVIYLYYYEGFKVDEIANILKTKPGTVKSRLYKARNLLKNQIENGGKTI